MRDDSNEQWSKADIIRVFLDVAKDGITKTLSFIGRLLVICSNERVSFHVVRKTSNTI